MISKVTSVEFAFFSHLRFQHTTNKKVGTFSNKEAAFEPGHVIRFGHRDVEDQQLIKQDAVIGFAKDAELGEGIDDHRNQDTHQHQLVSFSFIAKNPLMVKMS